MKYIIILATLLSLSSLTASAETVNPELSEKRWKAYWIAVPEASATSFGVYHFRKQVSLKTKPDRYVVHVSADNRYQLYVNDTSVPLT
jgi:hypothetical protein